MWFHLSVASCILYRAFPLKGKCHSPVIVMVSVQRPKYNHVLFSESREDLFLRQCREGEIGNAGGERRSELRKVGFRFHTRFHPAPAGSASRVQRAVAFCRGVSLRRRFRAFCTRNGWPLCLTKAVARIKCSFPELEGITVVSDLPKESCKPNKAELPDWETQV